MEVCNGFQYGLYVNQFVWPTSKRHIGSTFKSVYRFKYL